MLPTDSSDWTADALYRGTYERAETAVVRRLVSRGGTAVDVGANLGHYTTLLAGLVGETGAVLAFEPSPRCIAVLRSSVQALALEWVTVHQQALGADVGTAQLHDPGGAGHSGLATLREGASGPALDVEVGTLDTSSALWPPGDVDLLKIDTEGFEASVLVGAAGLIASERIRHFLIEVSPEFGDVAYAAELVDRLASTYEAFAVEERGRLRSRPLLVPISADEIPSRNRQFNLLLRRRNGGADVRDLVLDNRAQHLRGSGD